MEVLREHHVESQKALIRNETHAAQVRINRNRRRDEWLSEQGPCAECGSTYQLEIDHVHPELKTMEAADALRLPSDNPVRIAELAKCQVLCRSCHNAKTGKDHKRRFPLGPRTFTAKPKSKESMGERRLRRYQVSADMLLPAAQNTQEIISTSLAAPGFSLAGQAIRGQEKAGEPNSLSPFNHLQEAL